MTAVPVRPALHLRIPALGLYYTFLVVLLYVPIAILFLFALNAGTVLAFPLQGFTLEWFSRLADSPAILRAAGNSLLVAATSSVVATALGTMVSVVLTRSTLRGRTVLFGMSLLPLIVPAVVGGVALLLLFRAIGIGLSLWTVAIGHSIAGLPYALLIVTARLAGFDPRLEEAAMDLGASYPTTIRRIVLPNIVPAMISAWITAFTVSFDEFALALFLAGTSPTFPVYLFSQLRFASRLPIMIAMAVLLTLGTMTLLLLAERIRRVE